MSRRTPIAVVLLAAVLLASAAAAQPVRLWVVSPSGTGSPTLSGAAPDAVNSPRQLPDAESDSGGGFSPLPKVLAVVVIAAGAAALVAMRGSWPDDWPLGGARSRRNRRFGS